MDISAMNVAATPAPSTGSAPQGASGSQGSEQQPSFTEVMNSLTEKPLASKTPQTGKPVENGQVAEAGKLSYREAQTLRRLGAVKLENVGDAATMKADTLLNQLMGTFVDEEDGFDTIPLEDMDALPLQDLMGGTTKSLESSLTENGQTIMGEEWLLMLAQLTGQEIILTPNEDGTLTPGLLGGTETLESLLATQPETTLQMLADTLAQQQNAGTVVIPEGMTQTAEAAPAFTQPVIQPEAAPLSQNTQQPTEATATLAEGDIPIVEVKAETGAGLPTDGEAAFKEAVQTARANLQNQAAPAEKQELDLEALQQQVDDGVHLRNTSFGIQVPTGAVDEAAPPASTQLAQGVQTALASGEEQFTIRLMPEGLGELEVRLTKTAEGITLNIVAKNAETQKILAAEMDALRDTLRPMKVEVESILTSQQDALLNQQQAFYQQGNQTWNGVEMTGSQSGGPAETEEELIDETPQGVNSALDTYI